MAGGVRTVDGDGVPEPSETVFEAVTKRLDLCSFFDSFLRLKERGGSTKAHAEGCRQRARPQPALLSADVDLRLDRIPDVAPNVERADSLGAINLMCGKNEQRNLAPVDIEVDG